MEIVPDHLVPSERSSIGILDGRSRSAMEPRFSGGFGATSRDQQAWTVEWLSLFWVDIQLIPIVRQRGSENLANSGEYQSGYRSRCSRSAGLDASVSVINLDQGLFTSGGMLLN